MLKPFLQATFIILLFLATLAGCSDPTPAQAPTTAAAPVVAPSLTPAAPEPSETPLPGPDRDPWTRCRDHAVTSQHPGPGGN